MGIYNLSGPQKALFFMWYMLTVGPALMMSKSDWCRETFGYWCALFAPCIMLLNLFIIGPAYARWMDWRSKQFAKRFWENEGR